MRAREAGGGRRRRAARVHGPRQREPNVQGEGAGALHRELRQVLLRGDGDGGCPDGLQADWVG